MGGCGASKPAAHVPVFTAAPGLATADVASLPVLLGNHAPALVEGKIHADGTIAAEAATPAPLAPPQNEVTTKVGMICDGMFFAFGVRSPKGCEARIQPSPSAALTALQMFEKAVARDGEHALGSVLETVLSVSRGVQAMRPGIVAAGITPTDLSRLDGALQAVSSLYRIGMLVPNSVLLNQMDITSFLAGFDSFNTGSWQQCGQAVGGLLSLFDAGLTEPSADVSHVNSDHEINELVVRRMPDFGDNDAITAIVEEIVHGFLGPEWGVVGDSMSALKHFSAALGDFQQTDLVGVVKALRELGEGIVALQHVVGDAEKLTDDIEQIKAALDMLQTPQQVVFHIGRELLLNGRDILGLVEDLFKEFSESRWEAFGVSLRKLVDVLLLSDPEPDAACPVPAWMTGLISVFGSCCGHSPVGQRELRAGEYCVCHE